LRRDNGKKLGCGLKSGVIRQLALVKGHSDAELLAKQLYKTGPIELFNLKLTA
jgi:hypothetical protein